jgi:DNA invertase Pin-like site-specific DNA recombinase
LGNSRVDKNVPFCPSQQDNETEHLAHELSIREALAMKRLGYIRTSTGKQLIDRQMLALKGQCDEVFVEDGVSAVRKKRPVYEQVIGQLLPGDVLVVSSLDRAFRSVLDALSELEKLHRCKIQFKSLTQNFDTTTPEGKLLYVMAAALAEWERQTLSQRTKEGLAAARKRGKTLGRPHKLNETDIMNARQLLDNDPLQTISGLAAELSVSARTLTRAIHRQ